MTRLRFQALATETVERYRAGEPDANGLAPERHPSAGQGYPCRHCLREIGEGNPFLVLAHRPFPTPQPYAEVGPIFLCAKPCDRHAESDEAPAMFLAWERLLLRGYGADDRIVYGTGKVVPTSELGDYARALLSRPEIAYVHVRSASNNCYQARIDRA
ncbi:DUF1203 domain-containing protein [Stappia sp. F7233]|uniref:DUF1203 domain-containing protein n=1 Tax=Stappia albiluteola TaxID=2758565 RepID=A0A839AD87_9HYPH|nr:DUF1203 domain-containing protein [Stappia albiluteola]MBA5777085.1 DUF1203 domain-containing protein [Stappia albiluteola]